MGTDIETLQELLKEDSTNFQARRELSILLANEGFNEEALTNLHYLIKYFPQDEELHYNIGILHEKQKDFENAKLAYLKAIEISPQDDFYYNLGEVLVNLEQWDEAIEAFKTVLRNDSRDGNSYFNLGICYLNKEEKALAVDNFQKAIEINPKDIYAYFNLGNIYYNNGLTNFAEENYKKVLEISPDYSWAYYNLALIAFKNNNLDVAKEYLLKTIQYNNQDYEAYKLLTKIYIKENEFEDIITILESRIDKDENGDLYYILAQVYKHVNDNENYLKSLELALKNSLTLTYDKNIVRKELERKEAKEELYNEKTASYLDDYDANEDFESDDEEDFEGENLEDDEDKYDEEFSEEDFEDSEDEFEEDE